MFAQRQGSSLKFVKIMFVAFIDFPPKYKLTLSVWWKYYILGCSLINRISFPKIDLHQFL